MENFSYSSYPDSGDSSPRSREIDFENPPPWDDQPPPQNYKVKFMCSYGGKILPRPHDNQLCYIGGETKILAVDRTVKFAIMVGKLSALCENEVSFKYQLPGEDLDALISVTNDDDLEHMMHEYDRYYRTTGKPARMRLFLFPVVANSASSFGSEGPNTDRDQFVEALNLVQNHGSDPNPKPPVHNNVDFLFGLEKSVGGVGVVASPPLPPPTVPEPLAAPPQEYQVMSGANRVIGKSEENLVGGGGYAGENYYIHKVPEKIPAAMTGPPQPNYWPEKQGLTSSGGYPVSHGGGGGTQDHPVYMIPAHGAPVYHHQPMVRPEQPVYNVVPPPQQPPPKIAATYPEGMGIVRPSSGGGMVPTTDMGPYTQVAYDSATGRQLSYAAVAADTRPGGSLGQEPGKVVVNKVSQASV
uniref:PB1 domain-containing protein n=1 Tax=Cannabis sativa TaxID=3483 RepID=A0A803PXF1_CANSA